jgi:hypothetical protein
VGGVDVAYFTYHFLFGTLLLHLDGLTSILHDFESCVCVFCDIV